MKELVNITECQIDDMTGEELGFLLQSLIDHPGVLDAYYTAVHMKKNRPGNLLTVMSLTKNTEAIENFILLHSSTFGVRTSLVERRILDREFIQNQTDWGVLNMKVGKYEGNIVKITPEYEDVIKISQKSGRPFFEVFQWAKKLATKLKEKNQ